MLKLKGWVGETATLSKGNSMLDRFLRVYVSDFIADSKITLLQVTNFGQCRCTRIRSSDYKQNLLWMLAVIIILSPIQVFAEEEQANLATQANGILKAHCYRCHGETFNGSSNLNVQDRESLIQYEYLKIEDASASPLFQRLVNDEMPPEDSGVSPLSESEKKIILSWISVGAPSVAREKRDFVNYPSLIEDIHGDLSGLQTEDRKYIRYTSLVHLANNYEKVSEVDLRLYRAAVVKVLNSLSFRPRIIHPVGINNSETLYRIDIRDYGWSEAKWNYIVDDYPYGLHFHYGDDRRLADLDEQIDILSGSEMCWIRGDWLINTATRSPIYEFILGLPSHTEDLEKTLQVNSELNFLQDQIVRGGFSTSGVSKGNRLVERHSAVHGYYWKSFDFKDGGETGNLFRFPLGPQFDANPFESFVFKHDGGEMIFSLPNGLQGYALSDSNGNPLAKGPIAVVRDSTETAGTPEVVNAISCIHCHRHGLIEFNDTVREGVALFGEAKLKVHRLYPPQSDMDEIVEDDRKQFLTALELCISRYLKVGNDKEKSISQFAEPVGAVAKYYSRDLGPTDVACELGIEDVSGIKALIEANGELIRLGLGPIANGNTIKRATWEDTSALVSPFQEAARILRIATPVN